MGRLIDADAFAITLKQISENQGYAELYMNVDDVLNSVIDDLQGNALNGYENCPTVEAIPKAQYDELKANITMMRLDYETRLKADMVAMLTEIQLDIEGWSFPENIQNKNRMVYMKRVDEVIQEKIDMLKAETEDT